MYNAPFPNPQQAGGGMMSPTQPAMMAPPMAEMAGQSAGMPPQAMGAPGAGGGQVDPRMVQAMLALQAQQGQRNQVNRQNNLANMLRGQSYSQLMETKRPGVANVLAAGLGGYMANKKEAEAAERESALDQERVKAGGGYYADLVKALRSDAR